MSISYTPEEITEILNDYFSGITHKQYIGARYVPIFGRKNEESILWDNTGTYEPLTIVLYQGNSYTSRQYVPIGVDITNQEYWANTGNYNAQVEAYREEVLNLSQTVEDISEEMQYKAFAFETVADMKASEDLFDGAICHTNGFHERGDGGAAFYNISETGTANEMDVIACGTLFAHLATGTDNPACYGADSTGVEDSSSAINACVLANKGGTVIFYPGNYLVSEPIKTPHLVNDRVSIDFNGAILFTNVGNTILDIGGENPQSSGRTSQKRVHYSNGYFISNAETTNPCIIIEPHFKSAEIRSCNIKFFCVGILGGDSTDPLDAIIEDNLIYSEFNGANLTENVIAQSSVGIKLDGSDSKVFNNRILGFYKPIEINHGTNYISNCHFLPYAKPGDEVTSESIAGLAAITVNNGSLQYLSDNYCDTYPIYIKATTEQVRLSFTGNNFYSYMTDLKCTMFDLSACTNVMLVAKDNAFQFTNNIQNIGIKLHATNSLTSALKKSRLAISGNFIIGNVVQGDLLLSQNDKCFYWPTIGLSATEWAYFALIPVYRQTSNPIAVEVTYPYSQPKTDLLRFTANTVAGTVTSTNCVNTTNNVYGYKFVRNSITNMPYVLLAVSNATANCDIENIQSNIVGGANEWLYTPTTSIGFADITKIQQTDLDGLFTNV
ncbi:MAG: hypothetical protein II011_00565 [Prevotella sp.]|nr:hypothetical protein [Prevotella sp.]MBQ1799225.1 hypothetical protein [Prevotella sp.]